MSDGCTIMQNELSLRNLLHNTVPMVTVYLKICSKGSSYVKCSYHSKIKIKKLKAYLEKNQEQDRMPITINQFGFRNTR